MRVAADELGRDPLDDIRHAEFALFNSYLGMQHDLQEKIAKFLTHFVRILGI